MNANPQKESIPKNHLRKRSNILRIFAIPILVLLALEILSGSLLADERVASIPYDFGLLSLHALAKILLIAISAIAFIISLRLSGLRNRVATGLALLSTIGATIAGLVYQYAGKSPTADGIMGGLSGLVLIAAILLLVWGSVAKSNLSMSTA